MTSTGLRVKNNTLSLALRIISRVPVSVQNGLQEPIVKF